jgi:hypothetical protein
MGTLDQISASRPGVVFKLDDGTSVRARIEKHDPEALRSLFARKVVLSGTLHYMASGKPRLIDVEYIALAGQGDEMWSGIPVGLKPAEAPLFTPRMQDGTTGVSAIFGIWPGDETEEELLRAAEEVG